MLETLHAHDGRRAPELCAGCNEPPLHRGLGESRVTSVDINRALVAARKDA
jgi:hypothetical protein